MGCVVRAIIASKVQQAANKTSAKQAIGANRAPQVAKSAKKDILGLPVEPILTTHALESPLQMVQLQEALPAAYHSSVAESYATLDAE